MLSASSSESFGDRSRGGFDELLGFPESECGHFSYRLDHIDLVWPHGREDQGIGFAIVSYETIWLQQESDSEDGKNGCISAKDAIITQICSTWHRKR